MSCLELINVSAGYGTRFGRTEVLRDINLRIHDGEFVAIVGYSGAGKSTLINLISGLLKPDKGKVLMDGAPITGPGPDRGIVFQNYSLLPWLTVYGNIYLAVEQIFPEWDPVRKKEHVERQIALVNLGEAREKRPGELSGGMRQRVSVARALAIDPKVLLLDEPFSALDALTRATLQDELSRIWLENKKTVVMITNDPDEGIYLADRIIPLSAGPLATLGPSIAVNLERPRERASLNHQPAFKAVRRAVIEYLLGPGGKASLTVSRKLVLPDIEPEDLSVSRPMLGARRGPRRRNQIRQETLNIQP